MTEDTKAILERRSALVDKLVNELSDQKSPLKVKTAVKAGTRICLSVDIPDWKR